MNQRYGQKPYSLSRRVRLMERFLKAARQDPAYLQAERRLDRADTSYRKALAALPPESKNAVEAYFRAADSLGDATAAIAFFMGMAEGRKQKHRLHSHPPRGKV